MIRIYLSFLTMFAVGQTALATDYVFQSQLDRFTINVEQGVARFNGETVSGESFVSVSALFEKNLLDDCEVKSVKPDLTVTRTNGDKSVKRILFLDKGIISDGKNCANISGSALYTLPLHRNWFTGKNRLSIALANEFSILRDGRTVVEFYKTENGYRNKDKRFFTNWVFFEKFVTAIQDFSVDYRVNTAAAKEGTGFELKQGDKIYKFVKVGQKTWAVQFPNSPWFAAAGQFGIFEDMLASQWISPFEKNLKILRDETAPVEIRARALNSIKSNVSPDVKIVMQDMLLEQHEPYELKYDIVTVFRYKPSDENFRVLVDALRATSDARLLQHITKALLVRNPKGPVIDENEDTTSYLPKIAEWVKWRKTLVVEKK